MDGEQQYKDQQNKLTQDEKEQLAILSQQEKANGDHLKNNKDNDNQECYLDKIWDTRASAAQFFSGILLCKSEFYLYINLTL